MTKAGSAELFFIERIKNAIKKVGVNNPLLKNLYQESALSLLEKLLESTVYGSSLLIFVFHLSHLLLRMLLYPDSEQSCKVFEKLFTY